MPASNTSDPFEVLGLGDLRVQPTIIQSWIELADLDGNILSGLSKVPISHLELNFPLLGVPVANFILAVGYNAVTKQLAQVNSVLSNFENQIRVRCYVQLKGKESFNRSWPSAAFRIWDGLVVGPGYTRSRDNTSCTIQSAHWLSELDASTVASQDIQRNAADNFLVAYGLDTGESGNYIATVGAVVGFAKKTLGDMWSDVTLPMLQALMQTSDAAGGGGALISNTQGQFWEKTIAGLNSCKLNDIGVMEDPQLGNQRAIDILSKRFNQASQLVVGNLNFNTTTYSDRIKYAVANILASRVGSSGCLDKIFTIQSMFMFKLISNVESATLVPHMPILNQNLVWRDILASDYLHVRGEGYMPRRLQGVGLIGSNTQFDYGATSQAGNMQGAFRRYKNGQWLLAQAPPWIYYDVPPAEATYKDLRTSLHPNSTGGFDAISDDKASVSDGQQMGCRLAKSIWYEESYKNRFAELTGRLRFDIAPGSIVRVYTAGLKVPQFGGPIYSCVNNVKIMIDAADPRAQTSLGLSYLRDAESGDWADTQHPIYTDTAWIGSPLVKLFDNDLTPLSEK